MSDFRTETTGAAIAGTVQYRCAACGELMDEESTVFLTVDDQTRTYHPDHVPPIDPVKE